MMEIGTLEGDGRFSAHLGEPPRTPRPALVLIDEGLDDHPKVVLHDYPREDHRFAAEMGNRRGEEVARRVDGRTETFFAEHLG